MNLDKEKGQYHSIQAPAELKMKIIQRAERKSISRSPYLRLALACFSLLLSFALFHQLNRPFSIYVNQQRVTQDMQMLTGTDINTQVRGLTMQPYSFEVKVSHRDDYTITANVGEVFLNEKDKEGILWTLSENMPQKEYKLKLIGNTKKYEVIMQYDNSRDCWFIQYKEKKK